MKIQLLLAASVFAMPANAAVVTWDLWSWPGLNAGNNPTALVSKNASGGQTLDITAKRWSGPQPDALTDFSQLTSNGRVRKLNGANVMSGGLGVSGGASEPQVDTNQAWNREAFVFESDTTLRLRSVRLNQVDVNDTIQIYGVEADGELTSLGFAGVIRGTGGSPLINAAWTATGNNGMSGLITFTPQLAAYNKLVVTTRVGGELPGANGQTGQGFQLAQVTAAVPEPATWAMMVGGFGLLGATVRRSRRATVVYA